MTETFNDNAAKNRYELNVGGTVAFANYRKDGKTLFIDRVEAPPELRGTGAAGRLMQNISDTAKKDGMSITPICGYAAAWIAKNTK
jgi:predicted GNAT family acetyltransferase